MDDLQGKSYAMIKRPTPGDTTVREIRVRVCSSCGYKVGIGGLCGYGCGEDAEPRTSANSFIAVYERTDKFLRDEEDKG
jgi:hypothetical protein